MERNNGGDARQWGKLLWYDPNPIDNEPIDLEDLTISVDLEVTSKNRSVIVVNNVNNTSSVSSTGKKRITNVNFFNGSDYNGNRKLTTNYTNIQDLNSDLTDNNELLGIDSINIDFNSSYAPMVKIKFVDIRGAAMFANGGNSDYKFFFELPYPIFNLTIKGYYGRPVNYCLHLLRFNANFNSQTGNFEIDCDFIGFTYALLTDMLMGLVRASVSTSRGQNIFAKIKAEYKNPAEILTLDELVVKLSDVKGAVKKIKNSEETQEISKNSEIATELDDLRRIVNNFLKRYATIGSKVFTPNYGSGILVISEPNPNTDDTTKQYASDYKEAAQQKIVNDITKKLPATRDANDDKILKALDENNDGECPNFKNFNLRKDLKVSTIKGAIGPLSAELPYYSGNRLDNMVKLLKNINYGNHTSVRIIDVSSAFKAIDAAELATEDKNDASVTNLTSSLRNEIKGVLGFDPTIRKLFRILCISTEVFLECILKVSEEAEKDPQQKRARELQKLQKRSSESFDTNGSSETIFPWPEYREKGRKSDGYYEEWMGNHISTENVPELAFTEELLKIMLEQKRSDKLKENEFESDNAWYPISVIDTSVDNGMDARMLNNPYYIGLVEELSTSKPKSTGDSALRVLMYRAFLLLGVANRNDISDSLITTHAKLEAENLFNVIKKMPSTTVASEISQVINNYTPEDIYNKFKDGDLNGSKLDVNGANDKKFFIEQGDNLYYNQVYDDETNRSYIPINGHFDTFAFHVERGKLKDVATIKALRDTGKSLFVGNISNHTRKKKGSRGGWDPDIVVDNNDGIKNLETRWNYIDNDGAIYLKVITQEDFETAAASPTFGSSVLNTTGTAPTLDLSTCKAIVVNKANNSLYYNPIGATPQLANGYKETEYFYKYKEELSTLTRTPNGGGVAAYKNNNTHGVNPFTKGYNKDKQVYGWKNGEGNFIADNDIFINDKLIKHYKQVGNISDSDIDNEIRVPNIEYRVDSFMKYSLFGSPFYYLQNDTKPSGVENVNVGDACRALLFLHCFPFNGVIREENTFSHFLFDYNAEGGVVESSKGNDGEPLLPYTKNKAIYRAHNGFIEAPKIWSLFIGAMLWRMRYALRTAVQGKPNDPVTWYLPNGTLLIPNMRKIPRVDEFFNVVLEDDFLPAGMNFNSNTNRDYPYAYDVNGKIGSYARIDETLIGLPTQAKDELINEFLEWVKDINGFKGIRQDLEIATYRDFEYNKTNWKVLNGKYIDKGVLYNYEHSDKQIRKLELSTEDIKKYLGLNIFENYINAAPVSNKQNLLYPTPARNLLGYDIKTAEQMTSDNYKLYVEPYYLYNMELHPNGKAMEKIVTLLNTKVYLQNVRPSSWDAPSLNQPSGKEVASFPRIIVKKDKLKFLINKFHTHFKTISNNLEMTQEEEENAIKREQFNSLDDDKIKLNIYRTLMSIYQKWVGGLKDTMFTQCAYNSEDLSIAQHERNNVTKPRLIDSFRFLDRSFNDIGDDVYINPEVFHTMIVNNSNASFFDIVNKVLSDNNFNFIPLPTFVNFNKPKDLADIFTPFPWNDNITSGPSFVCVYVGQSSSNLNLGDDANYPDDGIFITVDINGDPVGIPEDLNNRRTVDVYETNLPVFTVNYGQQNQNYFKDIKLDQKEFSETAESLEIIDEISNNADKNKPIMVGQNLFNVYQKRSYSCEVEMLGCALVQPMMYFQLNNIPMFRGLYLIIKVSHSIKPNTMTTTFKGVRVKRTKTPLLTASDVLMTLVGDVKNSKKGSEIEASSNGTVGSSVASSSSETVDTVQEKLKTYIASNPINDIIEGNKVNASKIETASNTAITDWNKGTITEGNNENVLNKYSRSTGFGSGHQYATGTHWSAVFVSHVMSYADGNFPKSARHINYITEAMDGKNGYEAFPLKSGLRIKPEVGDIVCYSRNGGSGDSHCDIIYKIEGHKAYIIGGNLSDSVLTTEHNNYPKAIEIGDGTTDNGKAYYKDVIWDSGEYKVLLKKTNNAYFNKAKISTNGRSSSGPNVCEEWLGKSTLSAAEELENKKTVIRFFKAQGLNVNQIAGIMGNFHKETGGTFNHTVGNKSDNNNTTDYGIIQYNSSTIYNKFRDPDCALGSNNWKKSIGCIRCRVGETLEKQLQYTVANYTPYSKWKELSEPKNDAWDSGYWFARKVEGCSGCTVDKEAFRNSTSRFHPQDRATLAVEYATKLNDRNNELYFGNF